MVGQDESAPPLDVACVLRLRPACPSIRAPSAMWPRQIFSIADVMLDHQLLHMQYEGRPWRLVAQETAKSGKPLAGHGRTCTAFLPVDSVLMTAESALPRRDTGDGASVSHGLFPSFLRWTLWRISVPSISRVCVAKLPTTLLRWALWRISDLRRSRCRGRSGAAGGRGRCRCRAHCRCGRCCCARCLLAPCGTAPPCRIQQMQVRDFGNPFTHGSITCVCVARHVWVCRCGRFRCCRTLPSPAPPFSDTANYTNSSFSQNMQNPPRA